MQQDDSDSVKGFSSNEDDDDIIALGEEKSKSDDYTGLSDNQRKEKIKM